MICPYCQFERIGKYSNPDWECPSCKKSYNKFKPEDLNLEESNVLNKKLKARPFDGLIMWVIALFFLYSALSSLIDGEAHGFVSKYAVTRNITFSHDPIEFIIVIIIEFGIGLWILKKIFSKNE